MKIYTVLLFFIAALLAVIGMLICCGKFKKMKHEVFGSVKFAGTGLILVSVLLTSLGIIVISDIPNTVFLLVTGFFFINGIFVILRREKY